MMSGHSAQRDVGRDLRAVLDEAAGIFDRKFATRGPSNISEGGIPAIVSRIRDKLGRFSGSSEPTASQVDDLIDIVNYAAMSVLLLRGMWPVDTNPESSDAARVAYVAGPIDAVTADRINQGHIDRWRNRIHSALSDAGYTIYDPSRAWSWRRGDRHAAIVVSRLNRVALLQSSLVVAMLPPSVPTQGTIEEVLLAEEAKIPVVVVSEPNSTVFVCNRRVCCDIDAFVPTIAAMGRR